MLFELSHRVFTEKSLWEATLAKTEATFERFKDNHTVLHLCSAVFMLFAQRFDETAKVSNKNGSLFVEYIKRPREDSSSQNAQETKGEGCVLANQENDTPLDFADLFRDDVELYNVN